jgi:hypothetical protein
MGNLSLNQIEKRRKNHQTQIKGNPRTTTVIIIQEGRKGIEKYIEC